MPTLIPKPPSSPYIPLLEIIRSKSPDPRIVIYDSVELFSYLRDIDSLNTTLKLHGAVEMNSRLHSRVAIASLHQTVCKMDAYYPGNDKMDQEYEKNPAGHVGFKCPELRQAMNCTRLDEQMSLIDSMSHTQTFDGMLPLQFTEALTDFENLTEQLKRKDAGRWIMPKLGVDKEVWRDKAEKDPKQIMDENINDQVVEGRKESPLFTSEATKFINDLKILKCLSHLRVQDPEDPTTGNNFLRSVLEEFLDSSDQLRGMLMECVKEEYRSRMPTCSGSSTNILDLNAVNKVLRNDLFHLGNVARRFEEYLKRMEDTVLGLPAMIKAGLYAAPVEGRGGEEEIRDDAMMEPQAPREVPEMVDIVMEEEGEKEEELEEEGEEEEEEEEENEPMTQAPDGFDEPMTQAPDGNEGIDNDDEEEEEGEMEEEGSGWEEESSSSEEEEEEIEIEIESGTKRGEKKVEKEEDDNNDEEEESGSDDDSDSDSDSDRDSETDDEDEQEEKEEKVESPKEEPKSAKKTPARKSKRVVRNQKSAVKDLASATKKATKNMPTSDPLKSALKGAKNGGLRKKPLKIQKIAFDDSDVSSSESGSEVFPTPAAKSSGGGGKRRGPNFTSPKTAMSPIQYGQLKRQKRRPWGDEEVACVRAGVERYGEGNWARILQDYSKVLVGRTSVNVKDKWRNMNK